MIKNHLTGKLGQIEVPIYNTSGIDDLGSCITFLTEEGVWKKNKGIIDAEELDFRGKENDLIEHIEENDLEGRLRKVVARTWKDIQRQCKVTRKGRYQ